MICDCGGHMTENTDTNIWTCDECGSEFYEDYDTEEGEV